MENEAIGHVMTRKQYKDSLGQDSSGKTQEENTMPQQKRKKSKKGNRKKTPKAKDSETKVIAVSDDEEGDKVGKEGDSDEEEKQPQEEIKGDEAGEIEEVDGDEKQAEERTAEKEVPDGVDVEEKEEGGGKEHSEKEENSEEAKEGPSDGDEKQAEDRTGGKEQHSEKEENGGGKEHSEKEENSENAKEGPSDAVAQKEDVGVAETEETEETVAEENEGYLSEKELQIDEDRIEEDDEEPSPQTESGDQVDKGIPKNVSDDEEKEVVFKTQTEKSARKTMSRVMSPRKDVDPLLALGSSDEISLDAIGMGVHLPRGQLLADLSPISFDYNTQEELGPSQGFNACTQGFQASSNYFQGNQSADAEAQLVSSNGGVLQELSDLIKDAEANPRKYFETPKSISQGKTSKLKNRLKRARKSSTVIQQESDSGSGRSSVTKKRQLLGGLSKFRGRGRGVALFSQSLKLNRTTARRSRVPPQKATSPRKTKTEPAKKKGHDIYSSDSGEDSSSEASNSEKSEDEVDNEGSESTGDGSDGSDEEDFETIETKGSKKGTSEGRKVEVAEKRTTSTDTAQKPVKRTERKKYGKDNDKVLAGAQSEKKAVEDNEAALQFDTGRAKIWNTTQEDQNKLGRFCKRNINNPTLILDQQLSLRTRLSSTQSKKKDLVLINGHEILRRMRAPENMSDIAINKLIRTKKIKYPWIKYLRWIANELNGTTKKPNGIYSSFSNFSEIECDNMIDDINTIMVENPPPKPAPGKGILEKMNDFQTHYVNNFNMHRFTHTFGSEVIPLIFYRFKEYIKEEEQALVAPASSTTDDLKRSASPSPSLKKPVTVQKPPPPEKPASGNPSPKKDNDPTLGKTESSSKSGDQEIKIKTEPVSGDEKGTTVRLKRGVERGRIAPGPATPPDEIILLDSSDDEKPSSGSTSPMTSAAQFPSGSSLHSGSSFAAQSTAAGSVPTVYQPWLAGAIPPEVQKFLQQMILASHVKTEPGVPVIPQVGVMPQVKTEPGVAPSGSVSVASGLAPSGSVSVASGLAPSVSDSVASKPPASSTTTQEKRKRGRPRKQPVDGEGSLKQPPKKKTKEKQSDDSDSQQDDYKVKMPPGWITQYKSHD